MHEHGLEPAKDNDEYDLLYFNTIFVPQGYERNEAVSTSSTVKRLETDARV